MFLNYILKIGFEPETNCPDPKRLCVRVVEHRSWNPRVSGLILGRGTYAVSLSKVLRNVYDVNGTYMANSIHL